MEIYVSTLISAAPMRTSNFDAMIESTMKEDVVALSDSNLRTAMEFAKGGTRREQGSLGLKRTRKHGNANHRNCDRRKAVPMVEQEHDRCTRLNLLCAS